METVRYTRLGKEDLNLGTGSFEAKLADGRVVVLQQVDIGAILSDATLSSQSVTLSSLTVVTLTVSGSSSFTTFRVPEKADPSSPLSGEVWINSGGTVIEYADDTATPTKHALVGDDTTQTLTNKTLTSPAITTPVVTGTQTGTYALGGTPSLAVALDASDEDITSLDELHFADAAANPSATGRLRRSGNELLWRQSLGSMRLFYGESGTVMLFQQTTAPTGWTKIVTQNDKVLRVVSGAASTGGTDALSTMSGVTTGSHTLTSAEMPAHTHMQNIYTTGIGGTDGGGTFSATPGNHQVTDSTGDGGGHTHTVGLALAYVDIILASKD